MERLASVAGNWRGFITSSDAADHTPTGNQKSQAFASKTDQILQAHIRKVTRKSLRFKRLEVLNGQHYSIGQDQTQRFCAVL